MIERFSAGYASVQPVVHTTDRLWYYEWYAGVSSTNWLDPDAAVAADELMLETVKAKRSQVLGSDIGVNLAFLTAVHHGPRMAKELARHLPAGSVVEVTEHAVSGASSADIEALCRTCSILRRAGLFIALDDCVANHPFSDVSLWRETGASIIKVDMRNPCAREIAEQTTREDVALICECVESESMRREALEMGAHGLQGFHIGKVVRLDRRAEEYADV